MSKLLWCKLEDFPNYSISNTGLFRNNLTGLILKSFKTNSGYLMVNFSGKHIHRYIHRLVATAFIENKKNEKCVNHKDGNKLNNSIDNLEWCSYSYNHKHSHRILNNKVHNIKLNREQVDKIRNLFGTMTQKKIAKIFNVSEMVISRIKHNIQFEYKI